MYHSSYGNPGLPNGIYTAGNERLDTRQLGQMLYAEHRQRQAQQAQESARLDAAMQKEGGKMRSVDQPEFLNAASKWKQTMQAIQNDPKLRNNVTELAKRQQEARGYYNDALLIAGKSAEMKDQAKQLDSEYRTHGDVFHDQYMDYRSQFDKTPLSKLNAVKIGDKLVDLSNPQSYLHEGPDKGYYEGIEKTRGTLQPTGYEDKKNIDSKGLQYEATPYSYGNKPGQHFNEIMNFYAQPTQARKAAYESAHLTPEEYQSALQKYQNTPKEKLQKLGMDKLDDMSLHNPDNPIERIARYHAMQTFNESEPVPQKKETKTNELLKMQMQHADQLGLIGARFNAAKKLIDERQVKSKGETDTVLNGVLTDLIAEAKKNPIDITDNGAKKTTRTYNIPMTEDVAKSLMVPGQKYAPEAARYLEKDGKPYVKTIVYQRDKDGNVVRDKGKPVIDNSASTEMPLKSFRTSMGRHMFTGKQMVNELGEAMPMEFTEDADSPVIGSANVQSRDKAIDSKPKNIEKYRQKYNY